MPEGSWLEWKRFSHACWHLQQVAGRLLNVATRTQHLRARGCHRYMDYEGRKGSLEFLMRLAPGKVESSPFEESGIRDLKRSVVAALYATGWKIERHSEDRSTYKYLDLFSRVAEDPEMDMGLSGRMARLLAL